MDYQCDKGGKVLGKEAITCEGYTFITCSPKCMAKLMFNLKQADIKQVNTAQFIIENRCD